MVICQHLSCCSGLHRLSYISCRQNWRRCLCVYQKLLHIDPYHQFFTVAAYYEIRVVKVSLSNSCTVIIIGVYRPPDCSSWRTVVSEWRDWTSSSDFWRLGWRDFFVPTVLLSTFIPFFFPSSPLSLIVLFQSCCSHAQVFGRTLVHEVLFSYSHTELNFLFLKQPPLWHEATWDKPEASIKRETEEEDHQTNKKFQSLQ